MGIISNGNTIIDNGAIEANEVDTTQLASDAVETAKIASNAVTDVKINGMSSSKLSGALPAIDGSALTGLPVGEAVVQAWVNFNGTGTVAIRDSGNVTSITDTGTGTYRVNFTTAFPDANYCTQVTTRVTNALGTSGNIDRYTAPTTTTVTVACEIFSAPYKTDAQTVCVTVFQ